MSSKTQKKKVNLAEDAPPLGIQAHKTNILIWRMFMSASMKAAIHMGPDCIKILEVCQNTNFEELQNLFDITQKLVHKQREILNVRMIECASPSWTRSSLAQDQAIMWSKAKVRVYSDSVLWLGKMTDPTDANRRWEGQVEEFQPTDSYKELFGIDGEPIELEWNIFPGLSSLEILRKIQKDLQEQNIEPEKFEDRIIFLSMFNGTDWTRRRNSEKCISNSDQVKNYAKKFMQGHWTFLGLGSEKKWCGKSNYFSEGNWQDTANMMVEQFEESGHPVFKGVSLSWNLEEEEQQGDHTLQYADASNTELLHRTIHSANQLSIYGAVARWCEDFGMKSDETLPKR